jgi:SAM-dependent methyltransferase
MTEELDWIKKQKWFYDFALPDGTRTESYLPEIARNIHVTREKALRSYLEKLGDGFFSAIDVSCHEGFYSLVLAEYFESITGIDKNRDSLEKATRISRVLGDKKIKFEATSVEDWQNEGGADFVLCFGLLYHVENPIQILRKISALTKKAICIETQVLPFESSGRIEDGSYMWQRDLNGLFGLCVDYSHSKEGGLTDLALVPSREALLFLLKQFGFNKIELYQPSTDDYEQFVRGSRLIIFAEK